MDYADLRVLEVVARHGSMNRAAIELHTVQSNVTARIRALEDELGSQLFERSSRGVLLTAAGQRLLPYAARIGALLREAVVVTRDDGTPRGRLSVGALETTAALRMPLVLAAYAKACPEVDLTLTTGTSASLIADVLEYRLDGAFVAGPVRHPDLAEEAVFHEELQLVTAPSLGHIDDLDAQRDLRIIVFRRGCSYRQRLEAFLGQRGIQTAEPLEFGSLDAILGCVAAGVGVTMLPRAVVRPLLAERRVAAHALPAQEAVVDTVFIHRRASQPTSAMTALLATARAGQRRLVAAE